LGDQRPCGFKAYPEEKWGREEGKKGRRGEGEKGSEL
jgi:hypothetical protein